MRAASVVAAPPQELDGFVPASTVAKQPFWQYSIFGSGIGASNIILRPSSQGGTEIIVGGNSLSHFGPNDFWHVLRYDATTKQYGQLFVSPIYTASIERMLVGNVTGDSQEELVVMLSDGRIYLYDVASRTELGHITTGRTQLEALALAELDGDAQLELVVTNTNDLFVFDGSGSLLWQLGDAGGSDVVVGQMDLDPALEIATTKGTVTDSLTRMNQWTRSGGFGSYLRLAPLPGATYQQLIAASSWDDVFSYDVAKQLPRWSIDVFNVAAIEVADVNNDAVPELLIGDAQWGTVHVHDLITQQEKWATRNPEHGVTNIAVGDVDADGVVDLLFGAGWSSTGSDYLYVASTTGDHAIKWQSLDLGGPFLGPLLGDVDGDAQVDLVVCSYDSESGYDSGRILVFDIETLKLRAVSDPIVGNRAWNGILDLKLRDVDGDGRQEIIVAASQFSDGALEVYQFEWWNQFILKWTNSVRPSGSPFSNVEVADLDGDGTAEIIAGNSVAHTGSQGVYLHIFDYPATTWSWRSVNLASGFSAASGLVVDDFDGDGAKEFSALVSWGDLYTFDGPTRELEDLKQATGAKLIANRRSPAGLILGSDSGNGRFMQYTLNEHIENFSRQLGSSALDGVNVLPNGGLWVGTGSSLQLRLPPAYDSVFWNSGAVGPQFGRFVATDFRGNQKRVFSSSRHAVTAFTYDSPLAEATPPPRITPTPTATPSATPTPSPTPSYTPPPYPTPTPGSSAARLGNISTRMRVEQNDNALIGGFIITGTDPKRIMLRAIGPSLPFAGVLADPELQIFNEFGQEVAFNDDWRDASNWQQMVDTTIQPTHDAEAAMLGWLSPGAYTAIVRGKGGATGVGLIEAYDLGFGANAKLANISTRGFVQRGDDVMIGGFFVVGQTQRVILRAIGPSLQLPTGLHDPMLELFDSNGAKIGANNNWRDSQEQEINDTTIPPSNDLESAIVRSLAPGAYTAIVRGVADTTGIALVELYSLN